MESLQPNDQHWTNPLEFVEPSAYAVQAITLFEIQRRHHRLLDTLRIASAAYAAIGDAQKSRVENTPPESRRYLVYRRMHPLHSAITHNTEFGVTLLCTDRFALENAYKPFPLHVPVGEIVDGEVRESERYQDAFSEQERQIVFGMVQELVGAKELGFLPDLKYDLSTIDDRTDPTNKPTPLV